jgi:hypothetical protein
VFVKTTKDQTVAAGHADIVEPFGQHDLPEVERAKRILAGVSEWSQFLLNVLPAGDPWDPSEMLLDIVQGFVADAERCVQAAGPVVTIDRQHAEARSDLADAHSLGRQVCDILARIDGTPDPRLLVCLRKLLAKIESQTANLYELGCARSDWQQLIRGINEDGGSPWSGPIS